jgi:hypothetical protein
MIVKAHTWKPCDSDDVPSTKGTVDLLKGLFPSIKQPNAKSSE